MASYKRNYQKDLTKSLEIRISKKQLSELNAFCRKNKMNRSSLIRQAISNYINAK